MNHNTLALFDFDGTITKKDSFFEFLKFYAGIKNLLIAYVFLLPTLLKYKTGLINNSKAKELVISYFFKGIPVETFDMKCNEFALNILPQIINPAALNEINWHKQQGHTVCVVSASIENYVNKWCKSHSLDCIATKLQSKSKILTGKFNDGNCYGSEKVRKIQQKYDLNNFDVIYAYGDSKGDKEMLELSTHPFYQKF